MDPPVTSFWAKLRPYRGNEIEAWHPLEAHAADVAACFEQILTRSLLRQRLARLGGLDSLSDSQIARLSVLAALHDLGKYNVGFQNRKLPRPPFTADHVGESLAAFGSSAGPRIARALGLESLMDWGANETTVEDLLITALGHHGRPVRPGGRPTPGAWEPTSELDPIAGIADLRSAVEAWFPHAFDEPGDPLPDRPAFQHAFNGVLTLADWLGSNEHFFPFARPGDGPRIDFARARAKDAVSHIGLDARRARTAVGEPAPRFSDIWDFAPRPAQEKLDKSEVDDAGSLTVLEAPTGSGKTEAALIRFLRLFGAGDVDGLYFALPTRAAATQIHGRVSDALQKVIPDPELRPTVVRAIPGYLEDTDSGPNLLEDLGSLWSPDDRRWRYLSWASERPKRYLAGTVVVGTVDQVLLSGLSVDHAHLRAAGLLRHLLVVDEIHASDAYMSRLLEAIVDRHLRAGGHALLMSATLGEAARHRYLDLVRMPDDRGRRPFADAVRVPYPIVIEAGNEREPHLSGLEAGGIREKKVAVDLRASMEDPDAVARLALDAAKEGARVLAIRNTVAGCRGLQESLERAVSGPHDSRLFHCQKTPTLHHSRFAAPDRACLDEAVERFFGKDSSVRGVVLAATQTVEQSLDIDADLLITDLSPLDVLLQRIGRLHRHSRSGRPDGYRNPRVIVLVPADRNLEQHIESGGRGAGHARGPHGLGTVYEDLRVLEATWRELERRDELSLPRDNRELVERATHPRALEEIGQDGGGRWNDHARTMEGVRRAEAGLASLNLSDWSVRFGDPGSLFPDRIDERIRTRLGEGDRLAVLDQAVKSPFRRTISEVAIPAWMTPDAAADEQAEVIRSRRGTTKFRFGSERYSYDRLGLWRADT